MQVQVSTQVVCPTSIVFTYLTDTEKLKQWQTYLVEAEQLSSGDVGIGSKFRNVLSHPGFGSYGILTLEIIGEVLIFEPDKRIKIKGTSNIADLIIDYTLSQDGEKTIVKQTTAFNTKSWMMLPIADMLGGFLTEQFNADLLNLKRMVESEHKAD